MRSKHNVPVHFIGLVSDGGIHSHQNHLYRLCEIAHRQQVKKAFVHAFTDGRDCDPKTFVQKVEEAHQKQNFLSRDAVSFNLILRFWGTERLNGKLTLSTNSSKGLIEMIDGKKIYYIDDKVYHSPNIENSKGARFSAYTWSYFFLFPYKLSDEGTV